MRAAAVPSFAGLPWNEPDEREASQKRRPCAEEEGRGRTDPGPELPADDASDEPGQADGRRIPADSARPQLRRDEVRRKCLADGTEDALVEPVEHEEDADEDHVRREPEPGVDGEED